MTAAAALLDDAGAPPPIRVEFEPRMCRQNGVDATAGCSFSCVYCPFSDLNARRHQVAHATLLRLSPALTAEAPPAVFLSPASDPFAPQAAPTTHALLSAWLPRGTRVGMLTKGIIPRATLALLADFRSQVEGIGIGVTSLDDRRNAVVEPGCPPARERLANIDRLAALGVTAALRMDPLFPELDDRPDALEALVDEGTQRGAGAVVATYVFAWGRYLRRLARVPLLAASCRHLSERAPMEGGTAWSVPLARKVATYSAIAELARSRGLTFGTCGCKDLRMREQAFWGRCRMPAYAPADGAAHACR